jgi:hypothetical protein
VHDHLGEKASKAPSVEIPHRETCDKVFGEHLGTDARLFVAGLLLPLVDLCGLGDKVFI